MSHFIRALVVLAILVNHSFAATLSCGADRSGPFPCPVRSPENGHYYGAVYDRMDNMRPRSWLEARDLAATYTHLGVPAHLATVTSPSENEFLKGLRLSNSFWIGASDSEVEGEWRWMTGPEAGQLFWNGAQDGTAVTFADWHNGEPNNFGPPEHYATFGFGGNFRDGWNDLPNDGGIGLSWVSGYLVEFPVPEPSSYALVAIGALTLAGYGWLDKRRRCC